MDTLEVDCSPYNPYSVLFALAKTSSSILNELTTTTGPKTSSVAMSALSGTFLKMVGSI